MLLPLTCLKRDFLKVLQSLRGYIDTILPKSLGHIATLAYRQACPEAVVRGLGKDLLFKSVLGRCDKLLDFKICTSNHILKILFAI